MNSGVPGLSITSGMNAKTLPLVFSVALLGFSSVDSRAEGFYAEGAHASNAGATDRNLGRNFVQVGWGFANGIVISGGVYLAGEERCFESLTVGWGFSRERWQLALTGHDGGICAVDSRQVPFQRNVALCATRQLHFTRRWSFGIGGCVWEHADYSIGDLAVPEFPLSVIDDGPQLTAMMLLRFSLLGDGPG